MLQLPLSFDNALVASSGASSSRTLAEWLADTVNVLAFLPHAEHAAIRNYTSTYDCTAGIQAAVDYAIYTTGGKGKVVAPAGLYNTSDTIHLGYGTGFNSVVFEGPGYAFRTESGFNGTSFVPTFSDRPAFAVQGARGTVLRGFSIKGKLFDYLQTNSMGTLAGGTIDDTVAANWDDPALAATQDSRYCPYAGIAIDPYSGTRPATHYPDVTYPAFLGAVSQYGKNFSSNVLIEDVYISGFTVGVVNQPCNADGNGDFTALRRVQMEMVKWGVSVCNTQSRNVALTDVKISQAYCVLTNRQHGVQSGKFGGHISNLSVGNTIRLLDLSGTAIAGPIVFTNLYAESLWTLGTIAAVSSNELAAVFNGGLLSFTSQTDARGVPAYVLDGGTQWAPIRFNGTALTNFKSVASFNQVDVAFEDCDFSGAVRTSPYEKYAHNLLNGGLVTQSLVKPRRSVLKSRHYNLDTGSLATNAGTGKVAYGSRAFCIPLYAELVRASSEPTDTMFPPRIAASASSKASLSSCALSGKTLTIVFASRTDASFMRFGPLPGDVIWDDQSGSVFFVRSRIALTVLAELQSNFKSDGAGGWTTLTAFSTSSGTLYWINSRVYTPTRYLRGDLTSGSAIITNCARDDGDASYNAEMTDGDYLLVDDGADRFVNPTTANITAHDHTAGTITISSTSGVRTQVRRRLDYFIRQPPANV